MVPGYRPPSRSCPSGGSWWCRQERRSTLVGAGTAEQAELVSPGSIGSRSLGLGAVPLFVPGAVARQWVLISGNGKARPAVTFMAQGSEVGDRPRRVGADRRRTPPPAAAFHPPVVSPRSPRNCSSP